jgi:hypothetical protein
MLEFLRQLLGFSSTKRNSLPREVPGRSVSRPRGPSASNRYFELLQDLQERKKARDWEGVRDVTLQTLEVFPGFVAEMTGQRGFGLPPNIPMFPVGARAMALIEDDQGLAELKKAAGSHPDLEGFKVVVQEAIQDRGHVSAILEIVRNEPGILQKDIPRRIGAEDARQISTILRQMDEGGLIARRRTKKTYALALPGQDMPEEEGANARAEEGQQRRLVEPPPPIISVDPTHNERKELHPKGIDLRKIEYVPLPRAPLRWEVKKKKDGPEATDDFEVSPGWELAGVEKLPMEDRPDPAFRVLAPHAAGAFMIDELGNAERFPSAESAAISYGKKGELVGEAGFNWGLYRRQVHPLGRALVAMDAEGVIHAYDAGLRPVLCASLLNAPEMPGLMRRYQFRGSDLKNHTRSVALSPDASRYLFTVVDTAFVVGTDGVSLWALELPKQDGWRKVGTVSNRFGTSEEIERALEVLELDLPVTLDEVRKKYRSLAKVWHPDVNQGSREATERFKEIGGAAELLSGLDLSSLTPGSDIAVFEKEDESTTLEVDGFQMTISMQASEKTASDWIYAASFAADGGCFFAGYSGRIVQTDQTGKPVRAYDMGAVPRRIADTGDYLYFLTDTRLYILHGRALVRVMDIFEEGELVMGHEGFGLLDKKRFRWFSETGDFIGEVRTKRPIRRVYPTEVGIVVETRMRRAQVTGAPPWWE